MDKLEILKNQELLELYLNFSEVNITENTLIFESKFLITLPKTAHSLNYIDNELLEIFSKVKPKDIEILKKRLIEEKTLQDIGKELKITRERVRQIEQKAIKTLNFHARSLIINTLAELLKKSIIPIDDLPIKDKELKLLYCAVISHPLSKSKIIFDKDLMTLVEHKEFTFNGIVSKIEYTFQETNKSLFMKEDLIEYLKSIFPKLSNIEQIIDILLKKDKIREVDKNQYFFYYLYKPKRPMVEFIFSRYPDGIYVYQEIDTIFDELNKFFPNVFTTNDKKRGIATSVGNSENIYLWDWGKYIHVMYINPILESYDFTKVLHFIDENLHETQIDLKFCFDKFEKELMSIGIPNKFALHTCLKLKFPDDYSYQDSPWISKAGTERRSLNTTLMKLLTEDKIYTLDELVSSMKTRKLRVQQLIDYSSDVIAVDTFKYKNRKFIKIPSSLIDKLVEYANSKALELDFFYIDLIVSAFSQELKEYPQYDINTIILELLKKCKKETYFTISNTRIVNKDYAVTKDSLNFHVIINNLLINKDIISINDISNYFAIRGLSPRLITAYFIQSKIKMIVRLDKERYTSIKTIGLNKDNIDDVNLLVENTIDSEIHIEDLLTNIRLPKISVEWNRYILTDILSNDKFSFMPNRENPRYINIK